MRTCQVAGSTAGAEGLDLSKKRAFPSELISAINCKFEKDGPVDVSMDTESMGLHAWYPDKHIVSIGFTCEAGKADCLYLGPYDDPVLPLDPGLFEQIEWLLTSPKVKLRGSNLTPTSSTT